jgi:hypothetical protein
MTHGEAHEDAINAARAIRSHCEFYDVPEAPRTVASEIRNAMHLVTFAGERIDIDAYHAGVARILAIADAFDGAHKGDQ